MLTSSVPPLWVFAGRRGRPRARVCDACAVATRMLSSPHTAAICSEIPELGGRCVVSCPPCGGDLWATRDRLQGSLIVPGPGYRLDPGDVDRPPMPRREQRPSHEPAHSVGAAAAEDAGEDLRLEAIRVVCWAWAGVPLTCGDGPQTSVRVRRCKRRRCHAVKHSAWRDRALQRRFGGEPHPHVGLRHASLRSLAGFGSCQVASCYRCRL